MTLKQVKKKSASMKKAKGSTGTGHAPAQYKDDPDFDSDGEEMATSIVPHDPEVDPDDPKHTIPLARYNAMLAVLRNTLYMCVTLGELAIDANFISVAC